MSSQVERLEHNMVRLTVTVPAEEFEKFIMEKKEQGGRRVPERK